MQIELNDLFTFLFSFFGGGGLGFVAIKLFMQKEAKEAVKGDLRKIEERYLLLHQVVKNSRWFMTIMLRGLI